jgi:hypothetical protein
MSSSHPDLPAGFLKRMEELELEQLEADPPGELLFRSVSGARGRRTDRRVNHGGQRVAFWTPLDASELRWTPELEGVSTMPGVYALYRAEIEAELRRLHGDDTAALNAARRSLIEELWRRERSGIRTWVIARGFAYVWRGYLESKRRRGKPITLGEKRLLVQAWAFVYHSNQVNAPKRVAGDPEAGHFGPRAMVSQLNGLVDEKFVRQVLRDITVISRCLECRSPLNGRSDKQYCNDTCSTRYRRRPSSERVPSGSHA